MAKRPAEKLSQHWNSQKLRVPPGASAQLVEQFEAANKVALPAELRDFYLLHDGMDEYSPNDKDARGFHFWPLARIRPAAVELAECSPPMAAPPELDQYFAFADFVDWSWAYAIRLTRDPADGGSVMLIGGTHDKPVKLIASSFAEFVDLYLEDSAGLYWIDD